MKYLMTMLVLVFCLPLLAQTPFDAEAERRLLLKDVSAIPALGRPGAVYISGETAFPVILSPTGERSPLVVAGSLGKGRVVGFGHEGYVSKEGAKNPQICFLVRNAVRWTAKSKEKPTILVKNAGEWADYFQSQNFSVKRLNWNETITAEMLESIDVVFVNPEHLDQNKGEVNLVKTATQNGKGLVVGGLGWGWKQLNRNKSLKDEQKANILCADAGFEWTEDILWSDNFPADITLPEMINYKNAKQYVLQNDFKTADKNIYGMALSTVMSNLVRRQEKPFVIASDFPKSAPKGSPKVIKKITIDTKVPYWHCTGLYAQAGEAVTLTAGEVKQGIFKIRIGTHTDKLYKVEGAWKRHPEISLAYPMNAGKNEVFNPFGGMIYIEVPENYQGENLTLQIAGAVEAPFFKLGSTSLEEWKNKIRYAPAPWGEIEGNNFAFTVESEYLKDLENPDEVAKFWDKIQAANRDLVDWDIKKPHKMRLAFDRQISLGYMHSGYPIMAHVGKDYVDEQANIINLTDTKKWGFVHELGHNHQESAWTFDGTTEVTCNLFSMYALETVMNAKNEQAIETLRFSMLRKLWEKYLNEGKSFETWKKEPFIALMMYKQLIENYGWDALKRVFKKYKQMPKDALPKNDDEKRDVWLKVYSETVGENLSGFFDAWNIPISEKAKNELTQLPNADVKKLMGEK